MPSPKNHRKGCPEKNKKGRLSEKASSFHGRGGGEAAEMLPRPKTVPDLLAWRSSVRSTAEDVVAPPKLTKLLLNVTVQRSPGAVQVLMPMEATVEELIAAVVRQYVKEARRPVIPAADGYGFDLHYSQFSLESLDRKEKLVSLGTRNFFMCPKAAAAAACSLEKSGGTAPALASTCSKEANKGAKNWLKFLDFLM